MQPRNHIRMGPYAGTARAMERTPDERREILRSFMAERGLKAAGWAKKSGVGANSIYNFLNGESDALSPITYGKLARTAGVPVWKISGEEPEPPSATAVWVIGEVRAGVFVNAVERDPSQWYAIDVPVPPRFRKMAKALEVKGPSMNQDYPEGSIVLWVDMLNARPPRHLDHVIVYAHHMDGSIEATLKELRISADGHKWLWPKSDHPDFQQPLNVDQPGDHIADVEIAGLVVGDYRPRII